MGNLILETTQYMISDLALGRELDDAMIKRWLHWQELLRMLREGKIPRGNDDTAECYSPDLMGYIARAQKEFSSYIGSQRYWDHLAQLQDLLKAAIENRYRTCEPQVLHTLLDQLKEQAESLPKDIERAYEILKAEELQFQILEDSDEEELPSKSANSQPKAYDLQLAWLRLEICRLKHQYSSHTAEGKEGGFYHSTPREELSKLVGHFIKQMKNMPWILRAESSTFKPIFREPIHWSVIARSLGKGNSDADLAAARVKINQNCEKFERCLEETLAGHANKGIPLPFSAGLVRAFIRDFQEFVLSAECFNVPQTHRRTETPKKNTVTVGEPVFETATQLRDLLFYLTGSLASGKHEFDENLKNRFQHLCRLSWELSQDVPIDASRCLQAGIDEFRRSTSQSLVGYVYSTTENYAEGLRKILEELNLALEKKREGDPSYLKVLNQHYLKEIEKTLGSFEHVLSLFDEAATDYKNNGNSKPLKSLREKYRGGSAYIKLERKSNKMPVSHAYHKLDFYVASLRLRMADFKARYPEQIPSKYVKGFLFNMDELMMAAPLESPKTASRVFLGGRFGLIAKKDKEIKPIKELMHALHWSDYDLCVDEVIHSSHIEEAVAEWKNKNINLSKCFFLLKDQEKKKWYFVGPDKQGKLREGFVDDLSWCSLNSAKISEILPRVWIEPSERLPRKDEQEHNRACAMLLRALTKDLGFAQLDDLSGRIDKMERLPNDELRLLSEDVKHFLDARDDELFKVQVGCNQRFNGFLEDLKMSAKGYQETKSPCPFSEDRLKCLILELQQIVNQFIEKEQNKLKELRQGFYKKFTQINKARRELADGSISLEISDSKEKPHSLDLLFSKQKNREKAEGKQPLVKSTENPKAVQEPPVSDAKALDVKEKPAVVQSDARSASEVKVILATGSGDKPAELKGSALVSPTYAEKVTEKTVSQKVDEQKPVEMKSALSAPRVRAKPMEEENKVKTENKTESSKKLPEKPPQNPQLSSNEKWVPKSELPSDEKSVVGGRRKFRRG